MLALPGTFFKKRSLSLLDAMRLMLATLTRSFGGALGIGIRSKRGARGERLRIESRALRAEKGARMLSVLSEFSGRRMRERH